MAWEKVNREKTNWEKVDKTEKGWFVTPWFFDWFSGVFLDKWEKVNREKTNWEKVIKED